MPESMTLPFGAPMPDAERPLGGITVLLVEDSRYASEAVRLLCLKSGARIRRADCLRTAERHLATYRPTVVLIDLGLPDGSGIDLIARLSGAVPRLSAIVAMSGEESGRAAALAAGADSFLAKPLVSLAAFQAAVLGALKIGPAAMRAVSNEAIVPDRLAYRDDLSQISELLDGKAGPRAVRYAARFLSGIARCAGDTALAAAAAELGDRAETGAPTGALLARVAGLVAQRLAGSEGRRLA